MYLCRDEERVVGKQGAMPILLMERRERVSFAEGFEDGFTLFDLAGELWKVLMKIELEHI